MQQFDLKQIGLWVLIWLVGYGLGLFEAWTKQKMRKQKEPDVIQAPPQLIEEDYAVAIFEEDNALTLKMDGTKLSNREGLSETQRKRLIGLVVGLRPWLEGSKTPVQQAAPKVAAPAPAPAPAAVRTSATPLNPPTQPLIIERTPEEMEYASMTMVQQIDWLLQRRLSGHPLQPKRIRLQGALTGGVEFYVGMQRYQFIDEIEDPAIQKVIQEAIAEWEAKSTPGL